MKRWGARVQLHPEGFAVSAATEPFDRLKLRPVEVQPNGVGFQQRGNVAEGFSPFVGEAFTAEPHGKLSSPLPPSPLPLVNPSEQSSTRLLPNGCPHTRHPWGRKRGVSR